MIFGDWELAKKLGVENWWKTCILEF